MPRSNVELLKSNQEQTVVRIYSLNLQIDTSLITLIVTHIMDLLPLMSIQLVWDLLILLWTNNSNQLVKVTKNQTLGMLKSCDQDQICTIHKLVTFEPKSLGVEGDHPKSNKAIT